MPFFRHLKNSYEESILLGTDDHLQTLDIALTLYIGRIELYLKQMTTKLDKAKQLSMIRGHELRSKIQPKSNHVRPRAMQDDRFLAASAKCPKA